MRTRLHCRPALWFGLAAVLSVTTAGAAPVVWVYSGSFTSILAGANNDFAPPPDIAAGNAFTATIAFDSNAALLGKLQDAFDPNGYRYRFSNSSLSLTIDSGSFHQTWSGGSLVPIIVRDNFHMNQGNAGSDDVDGITFQLLFQNNDQTTDALGHTTLLDDSFTVGLRSTNLNTWAVVGNRIPTTPFPITPVMQADFFQYCRNTASGTTGVSTSDCNWGEVNGVFNVPEPASLGLALLGAGAAGLGGRRRQRAPA